MSDAANPPEAEPLDPYTFGPDQLCFGCGPHNPDGLKLRFTREGETVWTRFTPGPTLVGPPGVLHGGLQATIADEVAGWGLVGLRGRMGFTTSMHVRYMRPCRAGTEVEARAKIISEEGSIVTLRVTLKQGGKTCCQAKVSYALPSADAAEKTLGVTLDPTWRHLLGDDSAGER